MARITVEDCLEKVNSRFELVLAATQRARQLIFSGLEALVPWEDDKAPVVALREIAEGLVDPTKLDELERAREQELQAAEAGVSDSFMAGMGASMSTLPPTSTNMNATPSETTSRLHTLSSTPSLFEQVASQPGPVKIVDQKPVAADHFDSFNDKPASSPKKEFLSLSEAIARKEAEDKAKREAAKAHDNKTDDND